MISRRTLLTAPVALFAADSSNLRITLPNTELAFPPTGRAYRENGEAHRIWRRILEAAPDVVTVEGRSASGLVSALEARGIPSRIKGAEPKKQTAPSLASLDMRKRSARSHRDLAVQLSGQYGQALRNVVYIEALAVLGHLRIGRRDHVAGLVEPYLSGSKDSLEKATASHYSGHLLFAEYARATGDPRATALVTKAATRAGESPLDNEMSDSVFMVCPILAAASQFEAAERHFARMKSLCRRSDGLWRHSPLCDAAWGRGNAFPLLGLAWTLSYVPPDAAVFPGLRRAYADLAERLLPFQDPAGLWHQVIDRPESYAEFSATAMIALALQRGISRGWLARKDYAAAVARAWGAINRRTSLQGELLDVCESTGKQPSEQAYFDREAIFGIDPRGGAMALMLATELAA